MTRRHAAGWAAAALLVACGGCETDGLPLVSTSLEETTVRGVVRVRGKPVGNGAVEFNPANIRRRDARLRRATIAKDGTYAVRTLVGQNTIRVSCRELLTAKNRMFAENELALDAPPGETTFDIDIPPVSHEQTVPGPPKRKRASR